MEFGNNGSQSGISYHVVKFTVLLICYNVYKQLKMQGYLRYAYEYYILSTHLFECTLLK